ncbi:MAG: alpha-ketoacid dehydrogenase subunit beta [Bacillota bacterium]|nr:alpha-ketoacid dehydrogenase subunit beta [Bacillota bacterium]REJ36502.1 MAG: alpha-ketoacid dehydrogenase subunit beta [Bacillota bacterium]
MADITYREALRQALREEMLRDERVFLLGEDIGAYGGSYAVTKGLLEEFGEKRVKDTPISETAIIGAAVGAAMDGLRPVAEIMTINFTLVAIDQIINNAAKIHYMFGGQFRCPIVIRTVGGGRRLAATHSQNLEVLFAHIPGLKVVAPATPYDAKGLLKAAIRDDDPVIFIEHSLLYSTRGPVPEEDYVVPIGVSDIKRRGRDVTIVAYSRMVREALIAAEELAKQGIEAEVVDLRTLRPLDMGPVLDSVARTNRVVVVTEDWRSFGIGAEVAARIQEEAFDDLDAPVLRVSQLEVPTPYAANLEKLAFPGSRQIVEACLEVLNIRVGAPVAAG